MIFSYESVGRLFYSTMRSADKKDFMSKWSKVADYKIGLMLREILYKPNPT